MRVRMLLTLIGKSEIKPLLEQNCWKCHGADKVQAELVLTTREGVLKGRDWAGSGFRKPLCLFDAANVILQR